MVNKWLFNALDTDEAWLSGKEMFESTASYYFFLQLELKWPTVQQLSGSSLRNHTHFLLEIPPETETGAGVLPQEKASDPTETIKPFTPAIVDSYMNATSGGRRKTKGDTCCVVNFKQGEVQMSRRGKGNRKCVDALEKNNSGENLLILPERVVGSPAATPAQRARMELCEAASYHASMYIIW